MSNEWKKCLGENMKLPISNINVFEENGDFKEKIHFDWEDPIIQEDSEEEEENEREEDKEELEEILEIEEKEEAVSKEKQIVPKPTKYLFSSSTAKLISNVIGSTHDLKMYDKHHTIFKNSKVESSRKICQRILPSLQKTTKETVTEAQKKLGQWEKEFFSKNGEIPSVIDIKNGPAIIFFNKIKYGKQLLKLWNLN